MLPTLPKLVIALFLVVAFSFPTSASDLLLNGDFHDGTTHWHGDGEAVDGTPGLVIRLRKDRWTAVCQRFSAEAKNLKLKVTYSISDGSTLLAKGSSDELIPSFSATALERATGLANHIYETAMHPGEWLAMTVDPSGYNSGSHPVYVNNRYNDDDSSSGNNGSDPGNPRTFSTVLYHYMYFQDSSLCLAFPPGEGTVTITNVELDPPKSSQ